MKKLKRAVIKEELVELTGDFRPALILNQFIYWIERMYDTDKYILEEFAKDVETDLIVKNYEYEYKNRANKHNAIIQLYSKKMAEDLSKYGIIPNKTYTQNKLPNIPLEYMCHYIRGYFDGDGGISLIKPKDQNIHRAKVVFCADKTLAQEIQDLLLKRIGIQSYIVDMNKYGNNIYNYINK